MELVKKGELGLLFDRDFIKSLNTIDKVNEELHKLSVGELTPLKREGDMKVVSDDTYREILNLRLSQLAKQLSERKVVKKVDTKVVTEVPVVDMDVSHDELLSTMGNLLKKVEVLQIDQTQALRELDNERLKNKELTDKLDKMSDKYALLSSDLETKIVELNAFEQKLRDQMLYNEELAAAFSYDDSDDNDEDEVEEKLSEVLDEANDCSFYKSIYALCTFDPLLCESMSKLFVDASGFENYVLTGQLPEGVGE